MSIINSGSILGNILKDSLNELKGNMLGENYIYWIDGVETFDSPDDNYLRLKKFIGQSLDVLNVELTFYKENSPLVFHENSYKNVEAGIQIFNKILEKLNA